MQGLVVSEKGGKIEGKTGDLFGITHGRWRWVMFLPKLAALERINKNLSNNNLKN